MTHAWWSAALARQKTLPKLAKVLGVTERPQTMNQQKSALAQLSEQYGLPIRKGKKRM